MTDLSAAFGNAFDSSFQNNTHSFSYKEIPLFRALRSTLIGLGGRFKVEEYHGTGHQVTFIGDGCFARSQARCELSDLMIIAYSPLASQVRLTYVQAKSKRSTLDSVCGTEFSSNLEQWFLLSSRPTISGCGTFNPPPEILSSALLPSVGSFIFFYKNRVGDFQTFYASANHLIPVGHHSQRYGKLQVVCPCIYMDHTALGYNECLVAYSSASFAASLYKLKIGTPLHPAVSQSQSTRNWLAAQLRSLVKQSEEADRPTPLAQELLGLLASENQEIGDGSVGAKSLIVLRSDTEPNIRFNANNP